MLSLADSRETGIRYGSCKRILPERGGDCPAKSNDVSKSTGCGPSLRPGPTKLDFDAQVGRVAGDKVSGKSALDLETCLGFKGQRIFHSATDHAASDLPGPRCEGNRRREHIPELRVTCSHRLEGGREARLRNLLYKPKFAGNENCTAPDIRFTKH